MFPSSLLSAHRSSILHGLLFSSGGLVLVYEVLWLRRFTAVFGATTPATAATLTAVFVGLTAGSAFWGARISGYRRPLRVYGYLEIGAGLAALLVEPWLVAFDWALPAIDQRFDGAPFVIAAAKLMLTMVALFLPTFLFGGTLPAVAEALSLPASDSKAGSLCSGLYAVNTLGAAFGALSVPFFWLPLFGAQGSYALCVGLSLTIGLAARFIDFPEPPRAGSATPRSRQTRFEKALPAALPLRSIAALAALSGGLMFILQITWTRMFAQVHENSIYSFAVVVAVFILGLAVGATIARAALRRRERVRSFLGWAWISAGLAVFATPHLFSQLTGGLNYLAHEAGWLSYGLHLMGLAFVIVFVPTALAGAVLPLLMELADRARGKSAGQVVGWLLATNTAGVVAGSLLATFVLPGWLGLWITISAAGLLMILAGELSFDEPGWSKPRRWFVVGLVILGVAMGNPLKLPRTKIYPSRGEVLVDLREGSHGIVAVVDQNGRRRLKLDNNYVLGGTGSTGDERLQAHIPLLLHAAPKRVAFLGLGTGITAGAVLLHPTEQVTAVELVPEVVNAARAHFAAANLGVANSPRVKIKVDDARSFLRNTKGGLDVIVGDLVAPWRRGEAALYTAEHFAAARQALAPGGLFCQWLPMFQLSEEEFRIVAATFLDAFPMTTLWRGDFAPGQPALALIGGGDGFILDPRAVEQRIKELRLDDTNLHLVHPAGLWIFFVGSLDPANPMFTEAKRNRENRPWLEILSPLAHGGATQAGRTLFVGRGLENFLDSIRAQRLEGGSVNRIQPLELTWRDVGARLGQSSLLMSEGKAESAGEMIRAAVSQLPSEVQRAFLPEPAR